MKLTNFPQSREGKLFEKMVRTGFEPLKSLVEYERLQDELTDEDIHLLVHAIGQGLQSWCTYLKKLNEQRASRGFGD